MEDPEEDWSMEEYYPYPPNGEDDQPKSTVGWIWKKSLNLGKKVALTGVVISSAPIVLPPLVFMSALGFVVSIPMGVAYASYAVSEKLMSKLLPMPAASPSPPPWEELETDGQESQVLLGEDLGMEKETKHETLEDVKEDADMKIEFVDEQEEGKVPGEDIGMEKEIKHETQKDDKHEQGRPYQDVGVGQVLAEKPLLEERNGRALPMPEVKLVTIVAVGEEEKVAGGVVMKKEKLLVVSGDVELSPAVSEEHAGSEKEKEAAGTKHSLEKIMDEGSSSAGESSKKSHSKKKSKHHHHHSKKTHGISGKKEDKHGTQGTSTNGNHATSGPKPNDQMTISEEKMWDQINALRLIVGYKTAPHKSFVEELKALYIFTGVEPPSSFDQSIDLRDAEDKLHFLMSVVGVK